MLREALSFLSDKFVAAAGTARYEHGDQIIALHDGRFLTHDKGPLPVKGHLLSLESLIRFASDDAKEEPEGRSAVLIGSEHIRFVSNLADPRSFMDLPLPLSAAYVALQTLPRPFTTGQIRGYLRQELGMRGDEPIVKQLAKVQWETNGKANDEAGHGRDSMGRSVDRAVVNAQDIPEYFRYEFAPFASLPEFTCTIEVGVTLDTETNRIVLFPVGDEIAHGVERVLSDVQEKLTGDLSIPVYRGSV